MGTLDLLFGAATTGAQIASAAKSNKKSRRFARQESRKSRAFAAQQSGSVAQRGVLDLKAAGLNPILAANRFGGGSAASGTALGAAHESEAGAIGSTMSSALRMTQELRNLEATEQKTKAEKFGVDLANDIKGPPAMVARGVKAGLDFAAGAAKAGVKGFFKEKEPVSYINAPKQNAAMPPRAPYRGPGRSKKTRPKKRRRTGASGGWGP